VTTVIRENIAKKLLHETLTSLFKATDFQEPLKSGALQIRQERDGWLQLICKGIHPQGYGDIVLYYNLRKPALKMLTECERLFDALQVTCHNITSGTIAPVYLKENVNSEFRNSAVADMFRVGLSTLIISMMLNMGRALEGMFLDAALIADGTLRHIATTVFVGQTYEGDGEQVTVISVARDMHAQINNNISDNTKWRQKYLENLLKQIPQLIVATQRGRRPKDELEKYEEKQNEESRIAKVMRDLIDKRERITKAAVARRLNIGGKNRTQSLTNKLELLGLEWNDMVTKAKSSTNK
jgi:hypothetical protein